MHPRNSDEFKFHYSNFKNLFLGEMCIVENKSVEERMVQFNRILDWYKESDDSTKTGILKKELWHFSLVLAHTCRNSSIETWQIEPEVLGDLFTDYSETPDGDKTRIEVCSEMMIGALSPNEYYERLKSKLKINK